MHIPFVFSLACVLTSVAAQRTWIVDVTNPPGTNFTDIPPAEAAAADGDTLLVRAGSYTGFTSSKAIAVLGVPGATRVGLSTTGFYCVEVTGLPAGRVFRARGLVLADPSFGVFSVRACAGTVHLEAIDTASSPLLVRNHRISVSQCAVVTLADCGRQPGSELALGASNARLTVVHSTLRGLSAVSDPRIGDRPAMSALEVANCSVDLADCTLTGGNGAARWPYVGSYYASAPAISLMNGTVRFGAGATGGAMAGTGATPTLPVSAIAGTGAATIDNRVTLASYAGAPLIEAGVSATFGMVPGLSLAGGVLGGPLGLELRAGASQPCILAIGFVGTVIAFPFGDLFLDLATMQQTPIMFTNASGIATWTLSVPNNPALFGEAFTFQAGIGTANGLLLSNAGSTILH